MLTGLQSVIKDVSVRRKRTGVSQQLTSNEFMEINRKASQLLALFFPELLNQILEVKQSMLARCKI